MNNKKFNYHPSKSKEQEVFVKYTCSGYVEISPMERVWYVYECKLMKAFFESIPQNEIFYRLPNGIYTNKVKQYCRSIFQSMRFHFLRGNDDIFMHFFTLLRNIKTMLSNHENNI